MTPQMPNMPPNGDRGFVNLGNLKPLTKFEKKQLAQLRNGLLVRNGMLCLCGNHIEDEGVQLVLHKEGKGCGEGGAPGAQIISAHFCSRDCPVFELELSKERDPGDFTPLAIRKMTSIEWVRKFDDIFDQSEIEET